MSENNQPKIKPPEIFKPIEGQIPDCPKCGIHFKEPVAANYTHTCPACNERFFVQIDEETHELKSEG